MKAAGRVECARPGYYRLPGSIAKLPGSMRGTGRRPPRELSVKLPRRLREQRLEEFGGLCGYGCGRPAEEWDHLIPWVLGGTFRYRWNAVPACTPCNTEKDDDPPGAWLDRAAAADYSAGAVMDLTCLAIVLGQANPEDFMTAEYLMSEYPEWTAEDWDIYTIVPRPAELLARDYLAQRPTVAAS
jgi:hypothetical protein